jgi:subtilase family serine protease
MATTKKTKKSSKSKRTIVSKRKPNLLRVVVVCALILIGLLAVLYYRQSTRPASDIDSFRAQPFNKVHPMVKPNVVPGGFTPVNIKKVYNLGTAAGSGTIAIIDAYDDPQIENDLNVFAKQYGLTACTVKNACLEVHKMASRLRTSADWAIEEALDVEWAHAIAPGAKILLVEATSNSGTDLLRAIDYARTRSDVVAVSMSWGGDEFSTEASYEPHFSSSFGAAFFASSGDNGHGVSWPSASARVVSVGGTTVRVDSSGNFVSETAWSGSGGGVSAYIAEPAHQTSFGVPSAGGKRATPDVSYNADPATGYPVYSSVSYFGYKGWFIVGGTSAGAPQWAAIKSISHTLSAPLLYQDAGKPAQQYFRDILAGTNGTCSLYCGAQAGYDYVTGLGSPLGASF